MFFSVSTWRMTKYLWSPDPILICMGREIRGAEGETEMGCIERYRFISEGVFSRSLYCTHINVPFSMCLCLEAFILPLHLPDPCICSSWGSSFSWLMPPMIATYFKSGPESVWEFCSAVLPLSSQCWESNELKPDVWNTDKKTEDVYAWGKQGYIFFNILIFFFS